MSAVGTGVVHCLDCNQTWVVNERAFAWAMNHSLDAGGHVMRTWRLDGYCCDTHN